jgi:hypothetical protein
MPPEATPTAERRASAAVHELDRVRIERALAERTRYRYVTPRVAREGTGWKVTAPNCSRSVDPAGGAIDVAWFEPVQLPDGSRAWVLHGRDHRQGCWHPHSAGTLPELLDALCIDRQREFWQ